MEFGIFPGGRWSGAEGLAEGVGGFFSGGDNGLALRDLPFSASELVEAIKVSPVTESAEVTGETSFNPF